MPQDYGVTGLVYRLAIHLEATSRQLRLVDSELLWSKTWKQEIPRGTEFGGDIVQGRPRTLIHQLYLPFFLSTRLEQPS